MSNDLAAEEKDPNIFFVNVCHCNFKEDLLILNTSK